MTSRQKAAVEFVYVVMSGMYDDYRLEAVYATSAAAMKSHPQGAWRQVNEYEWDNDLPLDANRTILRCEVQS
jgi:hypothetical protein